MTFEAIVSKEVGDLLREKRFGGWALAFLAFWTVVLFMYLEFGLGSQGVFVDSYPESVMSLALPAYFVFSISFAVLALFILSDGIAKEREAGMLPLVGATPAVRWHIPLAKLIAGLAAYVGAFLVALLPTAVFAYTAGFPAITMLAKLFAGPFLALYLFMLGMGLLLGTAFHATKVAVGASAGIYFPLFLLTDWGPFTFLYGSYPVMQTVVAHMPFEAAYRAAMAVAYGGVIPWSGLAATVGAGAAMAAAAFWIFHRQEVAA